MLSKAMSSGPLRASSVEKPHMLSKANNTVYRLENMVLRGYGLGFDVSGVGFEEPELCAGGGGVGAVRG